MSTKSNQRSTFQDGFPARWTVACVSFVSFVLLYMTRVNITIAVVSMVNYTAIPHVNVSVSYECGNAPNQTDPDETEDGEFAWDESTQALVMGSFFWGYIFTQILGGRMSEIVGTKIMLGSSQVIAAILTIALPLFAELGAEGVIAARVLLGISQGVAFPSMQALISKWVPPHERSIFISFIYSGTQIGTVVGLTLTGYIIESMGWRYVFYIQGTTVLLFTIIWFTCIYDSPEKHPRISENEKHYILESSRKVGVRQKAIPLPIYSLLTSPRFWAVLVSQLTASWGFYVLLTELPVYLKNILHLDNISNSLHSALPYLVNWIFTIFCGFTSSTLLSKNICSTTFVRKMFNSIALFGQACCLILVSFAGCNPSLTYGLLTLAVTLQGASNSGFFSNPMDIAPNFAGTILGISGTTATIPGWVAPLTVGLLTDGNQTIERWRIVFLLSAGILIFGGIFFLIFATGNVQPWNEPLTDKDENDMPITNSNNSIPHVSIKTPCGQVNPNFTEDRVELPRLS